MGERRVISSGRRSYQFGDKVMFQGSRNVVKTVYGSPPTLVLVDSDLMVLNHVRPDEVTPGWDDDTDPTPGSSAVEDMRVRQHGKTHGRIHHPNGFPVNVESLTITEEPIEPWLDGGQITLKFGTPIGTFELEPGFEMAGVMSEHLQNWFVAERTRRDEYQERIKAYNVALAIADDEEREL